MNPFDYAQLEASMPKPITDEQRSQWAAPAEFSASGLWDAAKDAAPILGLIAGLSLLSRRGNGRNWAQALGGAGLDALGTFGALGSQKMAYDRQARAEARQSAMDRYNSDMQQWGQRFNLGKAQNDQYNAEQKLGIDQYNAESQRMGAQAQLANVRAMQAKNLMDAQMKAEERRNAFIQGQALYRALTGDSTPQQGAPVQSFVDPAQITSNLQKMGVENTSQGGWNAFTQGAGLGAQQNQLAAGFMASAEELKSQGIIPILSSSLRDAQQQAVLRQRYGSRAAMPGHSKHEQGLALDVLFKWTNPQTGQVEVVNPYQNPDHPVAKAADTVFAKHGLGRTLLHAGNRNEGGHVELDPNIKMPAQASPEQFMRAPTLGEQMAAETDPVKRFDLMQKIDAIPDEILSKDMEGRLKEPEKRRNYYADTLRRMGPGAFAFGVPGKNVYSMINQDSLDKGKAWEENEGVAIKTGREDYTKQMAALDKDAAADTKVLELTAKLRSLLENGADTGTFAQVKNDFAKALNGLGIKNISLNAQSTEQFVLETNKLLAEVLKTQKGSQSDKDMDTLKKTIANADYSPQANYATILDMERIARKNLLLHRYMVKARGKYGHDFGAAWQAGNAFINEHLGSYDSQYIKPDQADAILGARKGKKAAQPSGSSSYSSGMATFYNGD